MGAQQARLAPGANLAGRLDDGLRKLDQMIVDADQLSKDIRRWRDLDFLDEAQMALEKVGFPAMTEKINALNTSIDNIRSMITSMKPMKPVTVELVEEGGATNELVLQYRSDLSTSISNQLGLYGMIDPHFERLHIVEAEDRVRAEIKRLERPDRRLEYPITVSIKGKEKEVNVSLNPLWKAKSSDVLRKVVDKNMAQIYDVVQEGKQVEMVTVRNPGPTRVEIQEKKVDDELKDYSFHVIFGPEDETLFAAFVPSRGGILYAADIFTTLRFPDPHEREIVWNGSIVNKIPLKNYDRDVITIRLRSLDKGPLVKVMDLGVNKWVVYPPPKDGFFYADDIIRAAFPGYRYSGKVLHKGNPVEKVPIEEAILDTLTVIITPVEIKVRLPLGRIETVSIDPRSNSMESYRIIKAIIKDREAQKTYQICIGGKPVDEVPLEYIKQGNPVDLRKKD